MGDKEFDVSGGVVQGFRVNLDIYEKPYRPGFLIYCTDRAVTYIEPGQYSDLVTVAVQTKQLAGLGHALLSCHMGAWKTEARFHAHICAAPEDTLTYLDRERRNILTNSTRTTRRNAGFNEGEYRTGVASYEGQTYPIEELPAEVKDYTGDGLVVTDIYLAYHLTSRRIAIVGQPPKDVMELTTLFTELMVLYGKITEFYDVDKFPCHVVVDLGIEGFDEFLAAESDTPVKVYGYLEVPEAIFYKCCAKDKRETWYENLKKTGTVVVST